MENDDIQQKKRIVVELDIGKRNRCADKFTLA